MMLFTTFWSLDRTVDPVTGHSPVADQIAAAWNPDPGSVRFFRTSANFIYRLNYNGSPAFLRIAAASERTTERIQQEIDLLAWLTAQGIAVVQPLPASTGKWIVTTETSIGAFQAVLFDALPGSHRDLELLDHEGFANWGAGVGRLHSTLTNAPSRLRGRKAGWETALDGIENGSLVVAPAVAREARRLQAVLASVPRTPERFGLIHSDLELDNLMWQGDQVAMLDFDEFGEGWYLLDIAKALTDLLEEDPSAASARTGAFVEGYRRHHALSDADLALLPEFLALSELQSYCSLARAIDLTPEEAEVDWMQNLIVRLRAWMTDYEASLPPLE